MENHLLTTTSRRIGLIVKCAIILGLVAGCEGGSSSVGVGVNEDGTVFVDAGS